MQAAGLTAKCRQPGAGVAGSRAAANDDVPHWGRSLPRGGIMKAYQFRLRTIVVIGVVLCASVGPAFAQGIEDLAGFWCEASHFESTRGTCVYKSRGFPDQHVKVRFTVQGGEIITMKHENYWSNAPHSAFGWTFRALRGESSSNFRGSLEEFQPVHGVCNSTSATAIVSTSRKVIVLRYRGFMGDTPCGGTIGDVEKFLMRMK